MSVLLGRPLTRTEEQLYNYCMDERQAIEFAKHITLPDNASYELIENSIIMLMVTVKEAADASPDIEYICGHRRDTLRLTYTNFENVDTVFSLNCRADAPKIR